jgi:AcrR family transcriptional regulator
VRGRVPPRPVAEIAEAAAGVFITKGYRAAGVSDVATALGLSHGAVYTYAKSKEALLYLALLRLARPDSLAELDIPVPTPTEQEIVSLLSGGDQEDRGLPSLRKALSSKRNLPVAEEFGAIVDELYSFVENNRMLLALIERCARDLPELAQFWFVQNRRASIEALGDYVRRRIRSGAMRPVPDIPAAARFIVETIAWFAWHRIGDPDSAMLDDDACRRTVRHLLLSAFLSDRD